MISSENMNIDSPPWEETEAHTSAEFTCYACSKSFYNDKALQNHKNQQHFNDDSCSDGEQNVSYMIMNDLSLNGLCDFAFIPSTIPAEREENTKDGVTTRVFSEDTSFLIVKVDDVNSESDIPTDGTELKHLSKPAKEPVDLRGPFTCTFLSSLHPELQCRQIFFNCCEYSLHYREEHTKRRKAALRCQVCEKSLDRDSNPRNSVPEHIRPPNLFTFSCHMCRLSFFSSTEYDEHLRIAHGKMKPHQCSICNKRFTQQGGLQQHMRMHAGIRPFACMFCPKAFTQKAGLDQHVRTHTKVKPFRCVVCSKGFSQSVHLRQHMRTHTNIQPFECSICGRKFKQSSHLNFHMRSHMGDPGALVAERYVQDVQEQDQIEFLNLANLQPVQDGETLYYAAELASETMHQNPYAYKSQTIQDNAHNE